jgi:hypothetical protein
MLRSGYFFMELLCNKELGSIYEIELRYTRLDVFTILKYTLPNKHIKLYSLTLILVGKTWITYPVLNSVNCYAALVFNCASIYKC